MTAEQNKQYEKESTENKAKISIAIDGPAGAGKSTIGKEISKRLSITYVDTGAMYRAIGLKALRMGIDPADKQRVLPMLESTDVSIKYIDGVQHVFLDGEDVSGLIRTEQASHNASVISTIPEVRKKLVELQRALAEVCNVVMDGRDICSYVLPNATHKFFITARPEIRAQRRFAEYEAAGKLDGRSFEDILCEIKHRDERDSTRETAPLRPAADAVIIDTSEMDIEGAVAAVLAHI